MDKKRKTIKDIKIEYIERHMFSCEDAPGSVGDPQELIAMFRQTGDHKYFRWYLHFSEDYITALAERFLKTHDLTIICLTDLKMIAAETMWERLEHYSFSAGITFRNYARRYILNAMEDYAAEVSGEFSVRNRERYVNLRKAAAIYNSLEDRPVKERIKAVAEGLGVSEKLAEKCILWAMANKNTRSIYLPEDPDGLYTELVIGNTYPLDDSVEDRIKSTADAVAAKLDSEMLFSALDELIERDRLMILGRSGICPTCRKITKKKTFDELAYDCQFSSVNAAQKAYSKARERYIQKLVAAGFLHTLVLKRTEIKVKNGMTVFARYEYTPDYCKDNGIIEFNLYGDDDFDYINIVRYAENDDYGVYAGRAVRMIRAMYFSERRRRICTGNIAVVVPGEEKYETFLKDKTVITRA